jgi:hypothetical protein
LIIIFNKYHTGDWKCHTDRLVFGEIPRELKSLV